MGKEKYILDTERLFKKSPIVSLGSIKRIVGNQKSEYAKHLIRNLIRKGKIKRITSGYYTSYDEVSLAVFCFKPAYLGLQDALSFHNVWEQETIPIIITTKKVRQGIRKIFGVNVLIRRVSEKYFFGFDYYKEGDFYFPYSDIEKTFIDMVYYRQKLSKELLENFSKMIYKKRLKMYAKKYPQRMRYKIMSLLDAK